MSRPNYIPIEYHSPTTDAAAEILRLIPLHSEEDISGPHKLGSLVDLVIRAVEKHNGPIDATTRNRWRNAVTGAANRFKDGEDCLDYRPPAAPGGHGVYVFKDVAAQSAASGPPVESLDDDQPQEVACVYAWCLPHYQRDDRYPIKIGWTGRPPRDRIMENLTDLPEQPRLLMEIPCTSRTQAEKIEGMLHHVLRIRGHAIRDESATGREWFRSNVNELRDILSLVYENQIDCKFWED